MSITEAVIVHGLLSRLSEEELVRLVEPGPTEVGLAAFVRLLADARAEFGDDHPFVRQLAALLAGWGVATAWPPPRRTSGHTS